MNLLCQRKVHLQRHLVQVIEDMGNPFMEESGDLLVLDSQDIADSAIVQTVRTI